MEALKMRSVTEMWLDEFGDDSVFACAVVYECGDELTEHTEDMSKAGVKTLLYDYYNQPYVEFISIHGALIASKSDKIVKIGVVDVTDIKRKEK